MRKWVGYYNYTVILTYIGFLFGIVGVFLACGYGNTFAAICCLLIAGLCDGFDGKIANTRTRTNAEKKFGIQIDSLSDIVCFGMLPAAIGFSAGMREVWCFVILAGYVLCALIRLAYYNVTEEERQDENNGPRKHYLGLPVTSSCIIFPALYLLCTLLADYVSEYLYIFFAAALAITAILFIAPFRIKKFTAIGLVVLVVIGLSIGIVLIILSKS